MNKRELLLKAKAAIQAETKVELAERVAIKKRKELSAYLSAYKRAAEARRARKRLRELKAIVKKKPKWVKDIEEAIKRHREEGMDEEEIEERYGEWA